MAIFRLFIFCSIRTGYISDERFDRIAELGIKNVVRLFSVRELRGLVLVTNAWGEVTRDIGEAHENRIHSEAFKNTLRKGAQMVRYNTTQSAHDIIRRIMANRSAASQIRQEDITDIAALEANDKRLNKQIKQYRAELEEIREEMMQVLKETEVAVAQALKERDDEMMQTLKESHDMRQERDEMRQKRDEMRREKDEMKREKDEMRQELEERHRSRNPFGGLLHPRR